MPPSNGGVETRVASEAIVGIFREDFKLSDDCSAFLSSKPPMYRQQQLDRRTLQPPNIFFGFLAFSHAQYQESGIISDITKTVLYIFVIL